MGWLASAGIGIAGGLVQVAGSRSAGQDVHISLTHLALACLLLLCRQLWLYVGVYDFAGLQASSASANGPSGGDRWPAEWRAALGRVAVATPLLIVGWEQFKPDEMLESLASEFASRLTKLGPQGAPPALMAALQAALGGALGPQLPGPLVGGASGGCGMDGMVGWNG